MYTYSYLHNTLVIWSMKTRIRAYVRSVHIKKRMEEEGKRKISIRTRFLVNYRFEPAPLPVSRFRQGHVSATQREFLQLACPEMKFPFSFLSSAYGFGPAFQNAESKVPLSYAYAKTSKIINDASFLLVPLRTFSFGMTINT